MLLEKIKWKNSGDKTLQPQNNFFFKKNFLFDKKKKKKPRETKLFSLTVSQPSYICDLVSWGYDAALCMTILRKFWIFFFTRRLFFKMISGAFAFGIYLFFLSFFVYFLSIPYVLTLITALVFNFNLNLFLLMTNFQFFSFHLFLPRGSPLFSGNIKRALSTLANHMCNCLNTILLKHQTLEWIFILLRFFFLVTNNETKKPVLNIDFKGRVCNRRVILSDAVR